MGDEAMRKLLESVSLPAAGRSGLRGALMLIAFGAAVVIGYRTHEGRYMSSRLEDLLLLASSLESEISNGWQVTGRSCARVAKESAEGADAVRVAAEECRKARPRLAAAAGADDLRRAGDRFAVCRELGDRPACEKVELAARIAELELERSFHDLLVLDPEGRVLASWRSEPGGIAEIVGWTHFDREKPIGEPEEGQPEGFVRTLLARQRPIRAAPELVQVSLGGRDLDLVWMNLRLPGDGVPAADPSGRYALAGLTRRLPPGFERHEILTWHWVALALLVALPIVGISRALGGEPRFLDDRILIGVVLLMTLSLSGLGMSTLLVAERRAMLEAEKVRSKRIRDEIVAGVERRVAEAASALAAVERAVGAATAGGPGASTPECGLPAEVRAWLRDSDGIAFVVNAAGDQLCLENTRTRTLVNRSDRNYFRDSRGAVAGRVTGPFEIVNQQTGERNWVFGRRLPATRFPAAAEEDRGTLALPDDRVASLAFVTLPMPSCAASEAICLVVGDDGRIVFSQPLSYALSEVELAALGGDGFVASARLGRLESFTERISLRRERAVISAARLAAPVERYYAVTFVSMTPRFRSLQHALSSVAHWLFFVCLAPLGTLLLLSRAAPRELMDALLPRRDPAVRYASGALGLATLAISGFVFALAELDPWRQIELSIGSAFLAPMLALGVLGGHRIHFRWLPEALGDPKRIFAWYWPAFALATSVFLASSARELGRAPAAVVLGALLGPAALAVTAWSGRRAESRRVGIGWLVADPRRGYVAAFGTALWFLTCQPVALVTNAVLEVTAVAQDRLDAGEARRAPGGATVHEPVKRASRVLLGGFDAGGERRIAALQQLESASVPPAWDRRPIGPALAVGVALWAIGSLLWWAICARTFGWNAVSIGGDGVVETTVAGEIGRSPADQEVLAAVERGRIPSWSWSRVTRRLLRAGLLANDDGLALTAGGRERLAAAVSPAPAAGPPATPVEASGEPPLRSAGVPRVAIAVVAVPLVIWLMGQPALLGMVALWTTTLGSIFKTVKEHA